MQNSSKGNNSWKNHRTRTRRWYAHPPSILNIPMKFQWNPTSSFREFAWTRTVPYIFMQNSSKGNNSWKNHRTRTRRWYAHPPLILNIPMKFHWNPTSSFREFAWTRAGRTHGRTDARTHGRTDARTKRRLYAPPKFFGEHKKWGLQGYSLFTYFCYTNCGYSFKPPQRGGYWGVLNVYPQLMIWGEIRKVSKCFLWKSSSAKCNVFE